MSLAIFEGLLTPRSLGELVNSIQEQDFVEKIWNQTFLHVPGHKGRFDGIYGWEQLNTLLEQHRLKPPRLRVFKDGNALDPRRYLDLKSGKDPELNTLRLNQELAQGATLVIDAIEETYAPLRDLAGNLERTLRTRVSVNLYAGWGSSKGFDLHFDDHDVFILQVSGRKAWKIFSYTRPYPLRNDLERCNPPQEAPLWDSFLEEGDLLYIPRGWWHVAWPQDEPSLHLTIGMTNPTGIDFLKWCVDQLTDDAIIRRDIPHLLGEEDRAQYARQILYKLTQFQTEHVLDDFLKAHDSRATIRPRMRLPDFLANSPGTMNENTVITLTAPRHLRVVPSRQKPDDVTISCCGVECECPALLGAALLSINDGQPHTLSEILEHPHDTTLSSALLRVVDELSKHQIVLVDRCKQDTSMPA